MNSKSRYTLTLFIAIFVLLGVELIYLYSYKTIESNGLEKRESFVRITGLPDLAVSTEATYIRHRSLSNVFSIYRDDGTLREYFPSSYTISHSHIKDSHAK